MVEDFKIIFNTLNLVLHVNRLSTLFLYLTLIFAGVSNITFPCLVLLHKILYAFLYIHLNASATEEQRAIKLAVGRENGYVPVLELRNAGAWMNAFRPEEAKPLKELHWLTT
jgi:hypothetical protein